MSSPRPELIVDFDSHSFVARSSKFLEQTGLSEEEMKSSKPEELLIFGEVSVSTLRKDA